MKLRPLFAEAIKSRLRPLMVVAARWREAQTGEDLSSLLQESYWREELQALDHACRVSAAEAVLRPLIEALPLELFLLLVFTQQTAWPNIARCFPSLPSAELQERFTGRSNQAHLNTVNWFVAAVVERYERRGGRIDDATVLDVGCGWGRFMLALCPGGPAPWHGCEWRDSEVMR